MRGAAVRPGDDERLRYELWPDRPYDVDASRLCGKPSDHQPILDDWTQTGGT